MRKLLLACLGVVSGAALAQSLEPGLWEFSSTTVMPGKGKSATTNTRRCIRKEEAADPQKWWGSQGSDCKVTPGRKGGGSYSWEISCPKSSIQGEGVAKFGRGTMESTQTIMRERQGKSAETTMKMTGKRIGPC